MRKDEQMLMQEAKMQHSLNQKDNNKRKKPKEKKVLKQIQDLRPSSISEVKLDFSEQVISQAIKSDYAKEGALQEDRLKQQT